MSDKEKKAEVSVYAHQEMVVMEHRDTASRFYAVFKKEQAKELVVMLKEAINTLEEE